MESRQSLFNLFLVVILTASLKAVTVNSALCPTNKIAPHRRISRGWDAYKGRTLGAFYDLLAPGNNQGYDSLQEVPQRDDPDDCGDIDDYDEHDLSALTPSYQRGDYGYGYGNSRLFFGLLNGPQSQPPRPGYPQQGNPHNPQQGNPQYPQQGNPQYPQNRPQHPQYPQYRPPYSSGGYFENNSYRPPIQHYPSDNIKPVNDGVHEPQTTYRPHVVGGPIGHVVGVSPVSVQYTRPRPTRQPEYATTRQPDYERYTRRPEYPTTRTPNYEHYGQPSTQPPYTDTTRRSRPRQLNNNNESILGSFLDLLF